MFQKLFSKLIFFTIFLNLSFCGKPFASSSDDDDMPALNPAPVFSTAATPQQEEIDATAEADVIAAPLQPLVLHNPYPEIRMLHPHLQMLLLHHNPELLGVNQNPEHTMIVPYVPVSPALQSLYNIAPPLPPVCDENAHIGMPFKLGFEFQEGSGLCPWAANNFNVQKKPLFRFMSESTGQELWHIVLDSSDIEFVTVPFTDITILTEAIETILSSLANLQACLQDSGSTTFQTWFDSIDGPVIHVAENFSLVKDLLIKKPNPEWRPEFSPQVTIQHHLNHSILLYFSLFGFKHNGNMITFIEAFPFLNTFLEIYEEADYQKLKNFRLACTEKFSGLTFLQAVTMLRMTPTDSDVEAMLDETLLGITRYQQADVKMNLPIMSRRPFSSMLQNIPPFPGRTYSQFFLGAMRANYEFMSTAEVHRLFSSSSYADQYFHEDTGEPQDLSHLLGAFNPAFREKYQQVLTNLLRRGVMSSTMIKNLLPEKMGDAFGTLLLNPIDYFLRVVRSVETPTPRFELEDDTFNVVQKETTYDLLSPPEFLGEDDSMGAFKETPLNPNFGEAIVEVRAIKEVGPWFLKKAKLSPDLTGTFLTRPGPALTDQARKLFQFLREFGTNEVYMEDIWMGITKLAFKK